MISVITKCSVIGFHNWNNAPIKYEYLKHKHRHEFVIWAEKEVSHNDRDIEINQLREDIERWIYEEYGNPCQFKGMSCEDIAETLSKQFRLKKCTVLEDGLCGAIFEE